jgi:hypothetical protein
MNDNIMNDNMNEWNLWYHYEKDNWSLSAYKNIYVIKNSTDFWKLYNNWNKFDGATNKNLFLIKKDVTPIWEDPINVNGGCWSFKISEDSAEELWEDLSVYLVCNQICPKYNNEIVGLSICLKKNNNCIIKIWNTNSKNNSLKILNENILKKWGTDIIYIAHIPS